MIYSLRSFFVYSLWYKILIPWQQRDYRMLTALSLGLRPRESGQLSMIIPHNQGYRIYISRVVTVLSRAEGEWIYKVRVN